MSEDDDLNELFDEYKKVGDLLLHKISEGELRAFIIVHMVNMSIKDYTMFKAMMTILNKLQEREKA